MCPRKGKGEIRSLCKKKKKIEKEQRNEEHKDADHENNVNLRADHTGARL